MAGSTPSWQVGRGLGWGLGSRGLSAGRPGQAGLSVGRPEQAGPGRSLPADTQPQGQPRSKTITHKSKRTPPLFLYRTESDGTGAPTRFVWGFLTPHNTLRGHSTVNPPPHTHTKGRNGSQRRFSIPIIFSYFFIGKVKFSIEKGNVFPDLSGFPIGQLLSLVGKAAFWMQK